MTKPVVTEEKPKKKSRGPRAPDLTGGRKDLPDAQRIRVTLMGYQKDCFYYGHLKGYAFRLTVKNAHQRDRFWAALMLAAERFVETEMVDAAIEAEL